MSDQLNNIESEEKHCADQLKHWLETEAKFYGRTDEDFLLIFVRGCKHDVEKAKKKLYLFYENRKKVPQWWANRDVDQLEYLFQHKAFALLTDKDPQLPAIIIVRTSKWPITIDYDACVKTLTILLDIALRRNNCQKNGLIVFIDCFNYPFWLLQKSLSPMVVYNFLHGFITATPLRLKGVHFVNFPLVARAAWHIVRAFLSPKMRKRFFFYGSDFTTLKNNIDERLLTEEYGGQNGLLADHEDAFLTDVYSYSDYILDDNKYGFR